MTKRRNLAFGLVFAGALLLAQSQMAPYAITAPADGGTSEQAPPVGLAQAEDSGVQEEAVQDGGQIPQAGAAASPLDGGATPEQTLRAQLATQQEQVRLLQQQVDSQQASQESLARMQQEILALRQQLADAQARADQAQQAEKQRLNGINGAVERLQTLDQQLIDGQSDIDFTGLAGTLPPDAATWIQEAEYALARGDYLYARYYVELAVSSARTSVVGSGPNSVPH